MNTYRNIERKEFNGLYSYYISNSMWIDELRIIFSGTGDLFIAYHSTYMKNIGKNNTANYLISKEKSDLYQLFDELYNKIISGKVYGDDIELDDETTKMNIEVAKANGLIQENNIVWHCDDYPVGKGDKLIIAPNENGYNLIFQREADEDFRGQERSPDLIVRISNSGSRYKPFNICFMDLYNKLEKVYEKNAKYPSAITYKK